MKVLKISAVVLSAALVFSGCNMNNTAKGGIIGGGSGAVLGGLIGKAAGNAGVGAIIGAAVGTGAGVLIGNKMDKVKKQAEAVENAKVEEVKDNNGLSAVKCTFDSGILFNTGKAELSSAAKSSLNDFAQKYDIITFFFNCDTIVIHSWNFSFQFGKFMIMRSK